MDEIIYLESDEEITSVIDKIKNAKSVSLGLAVPRNATLLQSVVNLRLIARQAKVFGKQISIVTMDKIGRNLASQVGLPVYNSVKEEHPIFMPPPVSREPDEVIEIQPVEPKNMNMVQDLEEKTNQNVRNKVSVHHFQEDRPVIQWRAGEKPVLQKENQITNKITSSQDHEAERRLNRKVGKIIWPIVAVLLILMGIASYLLLPKSNIQVFVKSEDLTKSLPIVFTKSITTPDYVQNFFPGVLIEVKKEQSQKFPTTGQKNLGGKATGTVTFYNGLDSLAHKYPAGAKLIASNKTFLLKSAVSVPGATVQNLKVVPGSVAAEIEAENAGEDYNIKAGKFVIVGLAANQQEAIYAESKSDLKGGFTKTVQVVSKEDYENAQKQIAEGLLIALDGQIKTESSGLVLIDKSQVVPEPVVTSSSNIDQEASEFEIKVSLTKQVMAYNYEKFIDFLNLALAKQVPADKVAVIASADSIGFVIDKQTYDKGELDSTVNVVAKIATKIDADKIKTGVLGKGKSSAEQFALTQLGVEKVDISFRPAWLTRISELSRNVTVEIKYISQ